MAGVCYLVVLAQASRILVSLVAYGAAEGHLCVLVLLHVLAEVGARDEFFAANLALVGLLARMNALVSIKVTYLREGFAADLAKVGLSLLVNSPVVLL